MTTNLQQDQKDFLDTMDVKTHSLREVFEATTLDSTGVDTNIVKSLTLLFDLVEEEVTDELLANLEQLKHVVIYKNAVLNMSPEEYECYCKDLLTKILDDTVDSIYVILQVVNLLGMGHLFQVAWDEVQRANMSKAIEQEDGSFKVIKDPMNGKVLKPKGFKPPDINSITRAELSGQFYKGQTNDPEHS